MATKLAPLKQSPPKSRICFRDKAAPKAKIYIKPETNRQIHIFLAPRKLVSVDSDNMESKTSSISNEFNKSNFIVFRRLRLIWPIVFIGLLTFPILKLSKSLLALYFILYLIITIWTLVWPCPRCRKFFCTKFGLLSAAWPYINSCRHCGLEIIK